MIDPAILFLVLCLMETRGSAHQKLSVRIFIATLFMIMQTGTHPNVHQQVNALKYGEYDHMLPRSPFKVGLVAPAFGDAAGRQPSGHLPLSELPWLPVVGQPTSTQHG